MTRKDKITIKEKIGRFMNGKSPNMDGLSCEEIAIAFEKDLNEARVPKKDHVSVVKKLVEV